MAQASTATTASTAGSSVAGASGTVATVVTTVAVVAVSAVVAVVGLTPTPKITLLDQRIDINTASLSLDIIDLSSSALYILTLTGDNKNETYEVKEGLNEYYFINLNDNSNYLVDVTGYEIYKAFYNEIQNAPLG